MNMAQRLKDLVDRERRELAEERDRQVGAYLEILNRNAGEFEDLIVAEKEGFKVQFTLKACKDFIQAHDRAIAIWNQTLTRAISKFCRSQGLEAEWHDNVVTISWEKPRDAEGKPLERSDVDFEWP